MLVIQKVSNGYVLVRESISIGASSSVHADERSLLDQILRELGVLSATDEVSIIINEGSLEQQRRL